MPPSYQNAGPGAENGVEGVARRLLTEHCLRAFRRPSKIQRPQLFSHFGEEPHDQRVKVRQVRQAHLGRYPELKTRLAQLFGPL